MAARPRRLKISERRPSRLSPGQRTRREEESRNGVNRLILLALAQRGRDHARALALAAAARLLAEKLDDDEGRARAYAAEAEIYLDDSRYPEAIASARKAWQLQRLHAPAAALDALIRIGHALLAQGRKRGALAIYKRAFAASEALPENHRILPLRAIGKVLWAMARKAEAKAYYQAALKLAERCGDQRQIGNLHVGLGNIAWIPDQDARAAQRHYREAWDAFGRLEDAAGQAAVAGNLAGHYSDLKNYDAARLWILRALRLARQAKDRRAMLYIRINLAQISSAQGRPAAARRHLRTVEAQALKAGEHHALQAAREALATRKQSVAGAR